MKADEDVVQALAEATISVGDTSAEVFRTVWFPPSSLSYGWFKDEARAISGRDIGERIYSDVSASGTSRMDLFEAAGERLTRIG